MQGKQKKKEAKPDQASLLLKNIEKQNIEVFMSDKGEGYAKILINNHFEIWPINSRNFKLWVRKIAYLDDRMLPGEDAM
ncbi:MAG: hypothetical protein FIA99_08670 [Ruminiclostridium sp.]|nr:hypothetical protein [Ruminiclostridium sp.]